MTKRELAALLLDGGPDAARQILDALAKQTADNLLAAPAEAETEPDADDLAEAAVIAWAREMLPRLLTTSERVYDDQGQVIASRNPRDHDPMSHRS